MGRRRSRAPAAESEAADDAALVAAARTGAPRAEAALHARVAPILERAIRRALGPDRDLDDMVQDAHIRLLERLDHLADPRHLAGWAARIAHRTALDGLRQRRRRAWLQYLPPSELLEPAGEGPDEEGRELLERVDAILSTLRPEDRAAFVSRFALERSLEEVASRVGCSLATAKRRLARGEAQFVAAARTDPKLRPWLEARDRWKGRG